MSCTNAAADINNKFYKGSDPSLPTILVHYGPYLNWGRWNHNTFRIQSLIEYFLNEGYSVQLKHDEKEEGSGWVEISLFLKEAEGEDVLVRSEDVLHNRNYYDREEMLDKMASEFIQQVIDQRSTTNDAREEKDGKVNTVSSGAVISPASTSGSSSSSSS